MNENELIANPYIKLKNQAGIYIYLFIKDNNKIYIGSTYNLAQQFRQHRYRINNKKFKGGYCSTVEQLYVN